MEGLRQWAFSVCVAMVVAGVARMLLPKSGLQKVFGITVSVFFLCCLLSPVAFRLPDFALEVEGATTEEIQRRAAALQETVAGQSQDAAKGAVEKIIVDILEEMGINPISITIHINTGGQSASSVESADIVLPRKQEQNHEIIRRVLSEQLGFSIRLGYEDVEEQVS